MTKISKVARMYPNPENIHAYLGDKLKTKIIRITMTSDEIIIKTDGDLLDAEKSVLEEFFKYGLHSIWKFKEKKK